MSVTSPLPFHEIGFRIRRGIVHSAYTPVWGMTRSRSNDKGLPRSLRLRPSIETQILFVAPDDARGSHAFSLPSALNHAYV
jgi:hypothetical protein